MENFYRGKRVVIVSPVVARVKGKHGVITGTRKHGTQFVVRCDDGDEYTAYESSLKGERSLAIDTLKVGDVLTVGDKITGPRS